MNLVKSLAMLIAFFPPFYCHSATKSENKMVELKYEIKKNKVIRKSGADFQHKKKKVNSPITYKCNVIVESFVDLRINQQTLGATFNKPLVTNDVPAWLESIKSDDLLVKTKNWSGTKNVLLRPKLRKLYAYAESMNIHGVISLEIDYWVDGKLEKTNYYRGIGTKSNMTNALSEYSTALNYGVHETILEIIGDLKEICNKY